MAGRIIQSRGGVVVTSPAEADVLVMPRWADYCMFDRLSRPKVMTAWIKRGGRIIWEERLSNT